MVLLNKITKTLLKLYYLCTCLCGCAEAVEEDLLTQAADEEAIEASKKAMVELKKRRTKKERPNGLLANERSSWESVAVVKRM